jgi:hypothetical protein
MRLLAVILASLASGACLVGTTAPPLDPGAEKLPGASVSAREQIVMNQLLTIKKAEELYMATKGSYGTLDELVASGGFNVSPQGLGYTIEVTTTSSGYEAIAVPKEYGPNGKRSFYMDETGVIRGADHQGGSPSSADPPA